MLWTRAVLSFLYLCYCSSCCGGCSLTSEQNDDGDCGVPVSAFQKNSLVLLPAVRHKRSVDNASQDDLGGLGGQRKYHRLAHSLHVQSDIRYRYATTLVSSSVRNPELEPREVFLTAILPDTAFISRFAIQVGSELFVAFVKEKEAAWREYQEAVQQGKTAGHVGISARHSNHFRVSVNTEARSVVVFFLLYEELLQRRSGSYEHVINLTPRQRLKDFEIEVHILENKNLSFVHVPDLRRHEVRPEVTSLKGVTIEQMDSGRRAIVTYRPRVQELQHKLRSKYSLQFVVEYDVQRAEQGGDIQILDGYFVHFVAPEKLPPMPKHVIFVLDTSGSMIGKKMKQTKEAMRAILGQLREQDFFTIITFAEDISIWSATEGLQSVQATTDNLAKALEHVKDIDPRGGTDLNEALVTALNISSATIPKLPPGKSSKVHPMVFFLTDGRATSGEIDREKILFNVLNANSGSKAPVFTLAFGRQADFELLKILSLQNNGFARKIYVAADASLQLQGFYREVSSPILRDVRFRYEEEEILAHSLTSTNFHTYYQGSEMVVAGRIPQSNEIIEYEILATQAEGTQYKVHGSYNGSKAQYYPQSITETVFPSVPRVRMPKVNFLERLWAYLTIQDLLQRVARGDMDSCQQQEMEEEGNMEKRSAISASDDEDYGDDPGADDQEGSGEGEGERQKEDSDEEEYYYYYDNGESADVEGIMDAVGDSDIIICDNLERALYLSLKYEFVTPLTSLVVVKPDKANEDGDFGELGAPENIRMISSAPAAAKNSLVSSVASISTLFIIYTRALKW